MIVIGRTNMFIAILNSLYTLEKPGDLLNIELCLLIPKIILGSITF